jgi:outer membrane receptor protein involved in Fe transport
MLRIKVSRRRFTRTLSAALLGSTVLAGAGAAFAADAPNTVQEVIVTADKRAESIQKVPMSIQALDTKKLEELNITDFQDYSKYLPSLSVETTGPSSTSITMRGIASGENYNHSGPQPTVGFYLDEQPITTIGGTLDVHIYDIARIESLAGPQGTLYGASSESGTVRIITNKPDPTHFSASYDVQGNDVAHGGVGGVIEGYVNVPINDKVAIRLVGWDQHDAGFIDNVHATRDFSTGQHIDNSAFVKKGFNWADTYGGRAALKIDLNDSWSVTPSIIAQDQRTNGIFGFNPSVGDLKVEQFGPDHSHDRWYQAALTVQGKIGKYDLTYSGGYFHRQLDAVSDYMDYSYAYDYCCGYASYWVGNNGLPVANPRQFIVGRDEFWKNSHELRIASPSTDRFRFVAGLYFQRQNHWIIQDYQIQDFSTFYSVPRWPQTLWLTDQMRQDQDEAIYGQFDFDITDKLTLTGGIRGYNYRNFLRGFFGYSGPFGSFFGAQSGFGHNPITGVPDGHNCLSFNVYRNGPGCINLDKTSSGSGETHRLTLTYKFTPDKMMYATYSTGYRPGGVNRVLGQVPAYGADFLTNYEIGWKTSWMDHRLRWNGAIYEEDWNNFQFSFLVPPSITAIANAGHARVRGIESNVDWVPTEHLTITASGAYNDARLTADYCGVVGVTSCPGLPPLAPHGETLPRTPPFKGNLTARYTFDMGPWAAHLQGSAVYADSTWPELVLADRMNEGRMPSYSLFDFAFGAEHGNMSWELFVKNAFDQRANLTRATPCTTGVCAPPIPPTNYSAVYVFPETPRLIGLKFGQKF